MSIDSGSYLAFVITSIMIFFTPGPTLLLIVGHSLSLGWRTAMITVSGMIFGESILIALLAIGMHSLNGHASAWFDIVRWLGVAYLTYLGICEWMSGSSTNPVSYHVPRGLIFMQGLAVNSLNPQTFLFLAAFLPQFLNPVSASQLDFAILGITFVGIDILLMGACVVLADRVRLLLLAPRRTLWRSRITAVVLMGTGVALAVANA